MNYFEFDEEELKFRFDAGFLNLVTGFSMDTIYRLSRKGLIGKNTKGATDAETPSYVYSSSDIDFLKSYKPKFGRPRKSV